MYLIFNIKFMIMESKILVEILVENTSSEDRLIGKNKVEGGGS